MTIATQMLRRSVTGRLSPSRRRKLVDPLGVTFGRLGVTFGRRPIALVFDAAHSRQACGAIGATHSLPANIVRDVAQAKLNKPWMRRRVTQSIGQQGL